MANKVLKSLTFPGLNDVYKIPQEADEYSASATYAVGDYCIKDGVLYRCTTAITTAEAWTAGHWTATQLADEVTSQSEKIEEVKTALNGDIYPALKTLGFGFELLTTNDFEYGAYLSAAGRRTDGAYGLLKSSDTMLPVENITITLDADDVGSTNYCYTIALYNNNTFLSNYNTNYQFTNGVVSILASDIKARFSNANGMRINVSVLNDGSFVKFPETTGILVSSSSSRIYIVDEKGFGDYSSLYVAVNALPENSIIFVKAGNYLIPNSRYLGLRDKGMYIIGEDRDSCIITSYDGRYEYPTVWAKSGLLENLTIKSVYLQGTSNEIDSNTNGAYAIHYDRETAVGTTLTIRNCNIISDFNCGIGIGMRKDATLNVEDCFIKSNMVSGRGKYNYGALLVHDSIGEQGNQYFNLINCSLMSNLGVTMTVNVATGGNNTVYCKILNNVLKDAQNGYSNNVTLSNTPFASIFVKELCYGNSNNDLNES